VRRNLEELLQQQIDELWSDPRRRRVGDERACDVDADRVVKIGDDAVDEVDQSRVVTQRGGRRLEHQPGDPIRMIECDPPRNETRARVAGKDGPLDPAGVEQRNHVGREVLDAVSAVRLVGVAVAALGHGDGP